MDNFPFLAFVTMAIFVGSLMAAKWLDTINGRRRHGGRNSHRPRLEP